MWSILNPALNRIFSNFFGVIVILGMEAGRDVDHSNKAFFVLRYGLLVFFHRCDVSFYGISGHFFCFTEIFAVSNTPRERWHNNRKSALWFGSEDSMEL